MLVPIGLLAATPMASPAAAPSFSESYRSLAGTPGFRDLRAELQRTVDDFGHVRVNHFCVVVQVLRSEGGLSPTSVPSPSGRRGN